MTDRDLTQAEIEQLERLIDKVSLQSVLMALSEICDLKSEHLAVRWGDKVMARRWATICSRIGCLVTKCEGM